MSMHRHRVAGYADGNPAQDDGGTAGHALFPTVNGTCVPGDLRGPIRSMAAETIDVVGRLLRSIPREYPEEIVPAAKRRRDLASSPRTVSPIFDREYYR
jgi:hypothetical protein